MTGTIIYLAILYCGLSLMRDVAKILDYINNYKSKNDEVNN